ncbi:patatin-like phospholipase family protein [Burkholderia cenocepacia]|uniref:patatin-like phospholipase family protein n=1 Tax=Burkholderia cenocepacia TaxID=95486 RepID=UPI00163A69B2|nr:patatin-like phospholipase family protein [Burkholderia cenocepacia]MBR8512230.1 patatin-like phospholipase family protein [Burkholderia cenocepacia]
MSAAIEIPEAEKKYRPFLGVAISGGGSRAANFGMYILKELERLGVLNRIDAISSVSGGSIAAAHFGLYYPKLRGDYWDFAEKIYVRISEMIGLRDMPILLIGER